MPLSNRWFVLLLCVVCIVAIALRLYKFDAPIADWHSWRQVDTAAVARNFLTLGIDPFRPRYDDLSNIQSGKDNPQGYRMVEFPLYQLSAVGLYTLFPQLTIEQSLRLVSIFSVVGTIIFLTLLVRAYINPFTAVIAGLFYAIWPYSIYYGRATLPEPFMVFWAVFGIYCLHRHFDGTSKKKLFLSSWLILSMVACAVSLLVKPVAIFLLFPIAGLFVTRMQLRKQWFILFALYAAGVAFPIWWWRSWIVQFPEGIPSYTWLLNEGNIRFKGAWFYWLYAKRIGELLLGYWGLVPLVLGMGLTREKHEGWLFRLWLFGLLMYLVVFARGNVQHDYYQILLLPALAVYCAKGLTWLLRTPLMFFPMRMTLTAVILVFSFGFSWYTIRTYYWINRQDIVSAGKAADALLPKAAKVIAPYNGDTTFLYQTKRQGWPIGFDIAKKISQGATHYVTVSPTDTDFETKELAQVYTVLIRNESFAIIDLTKKK